jgi:hypothetical protein
VSPSLESGRVLCLNQQTEYERSDVVPTSKPGLFETLLVENAASMLKGSPQTGLQEEELRTLPKIPGKN